MQKLAYRIAASLTAIMIAGTTTAGAAMLRGEDPEFQAAWRALQAKEACTLSTTVQTPAKRFATLPVEAVGNTPHDVCTAVRNRINYISDNGDTWQSAAETWARRAGDCEDFAIVVRDLCRAKGITANVYVFYPTTSNTGHAVTIGHSIDGMWMSSNGSFERVTSLADARNAIIRRHGWINDSVAHYKTTGSGKQFAKTALR